MEDFVGDPALASDSDSGDGSDSSNVSASAAQVLVPKRRRTQCQDDIVWPVAWNYHTSNVQQMCHPVSSVLIRFFDGVWLGKEEVNKMMAYDPVRGLCAWMPDKVNRREILSLISIGAEGGLVVSQRTGFAGGSQA